MCRRRNNHPSLVVIAGTAAISAMERQRTNRQAPKLEPYPELIDPISYDRHQVPQQTHTVHSPAYDLDDLVRELSLHDGKPLEGGPNAEHDLPPAYTPRDSQPTSTRNSRPLNTAQVRFSPTLQTAPPASTAAAQTNPPAYKDLLVAIPLLSRYAAHPSIPRLANEFVLASDELALAQRQTGGSSCGLKSQRRRVKWARKALLREVLRLEHTRLGGRGNTGSACGIRGKEAKRMWKDEKRALKWGLRGFFAGGH